MRRRGGVPRDSDYYGAIVKNTLPFFLLWGLLWQMPALSDTAIYPDGSCFYYENISNGMTSDYYRYITSLIKIILNENINANVIFGNSNVNFQNNFKTIRINYNFEHTLVKRGGEKRSCGLSFWNGQNKR